MSSWGQIAVILYTDRVWLQRLHGIASSRRTNASSKDFLVQTVSGSCGDAIVRHTAYVRLAVATCEAGFRNSGDHPALELLADELSVRRLDEVPT